MNVPSSATTSEFVVFLVDDDPGVLRAVSRLFQSAGYKTKAYSSPQSFLAEHDPSIPGCAVLDLAMPKLNGLEVQQVLERQGTGRPIIFLSGRGTIPDSVRAMRSGALDFLSKPIDKSELLHAVKLAEERDRARRRADVARLTRREREVLPLVVAGLHNEEIATKLGVAHKTIKVHRARMMKKMGVRSLAELVRLTSRAFSPPQ